jgi:hypothetical protein
MAMAIDNLVQAQTDLDLLAHAMSAGKVPIEEKARQLRKELEALQSGAGNIARQGQQLRERKAQLESLRTLLGQRLSELSNLVRLRAGALDRLDEIRDARFDARLDAAAKLNAVLAPRIRITLGRAGQFEAFAGAIADALKGSGLKYGDLAPALATKVSPRELLEAVEMDDVEFICQTTGISADSSRPLH